MPHLAYCLQALAAAAVLCAALPTPRETNKPPPSAAAATATALFVPTRVMRTQTRATRTPTPARAECNGTDTMSYASVVSVRRRYELYREHYAGCKLVKGDLVLTKLSDPSMTYDMRFLSEIEEIAGYLLIQGVLADEIPLVSLRTIKGRRLYKNFYAVFVESNYLSPAKGLRELQMPMLKSIDRGDVRIGRNPNLCFMEDIEWGRLMKEQSATLDKTNKPGELATSDRCGHCHAECAKHCWGRGENMCQDRATLFAQRPYRSNTDNNSEPCNTTRSCRGGGGRTSPRPATGAGRKTRRPCAEANLIDCNPRKSKQQRNFLATAVLPIAVATSAATTATMATAETPAAATPTE